MQVLVSVNSVAEAQLVLSAGVSLIDLKDTSHGALAALDLDVSKAIVDTVNAYRQQSAATGIIISATVGDHCTSVADLIQLIESRLNLGVEVIKLPETIWEDPDYQPTIAAFLEQGIRLIAVLTPASLSEARMAGRVQSLAQQGYWGVMVDTTLKSSPLTEMVSLSALANFVHAAKTAQLFVGLAGGLSLSHVEPLAALGADYVGYRSGLCVDGQRAQGLLTSKVQQLVARVSEIC